MASYPSSIASFTTHNTGDVIQASDVNNPNAEIVAVETGLLNGFQHAAKPNANATYSLGTSGLQWTNVFLSTGLAGVNTLISDGGRLTLTTGTPVTSSDVTAATTLYYTPYNGSVIGLYNGTNWTTEAFNEVSIAVPATTSQMYDVFGYDNGGTFTLELLAWTNDTTRATSLTLLSGKYLKTGALTRRYLGSFRTTGVSGQTEDSAAKRYVWNNINRVPRLLQKQDSTASWAYTTATVRQGNGNAANQVEVVQGLNESPVEVSLLMQADNTNTGVAVQTGIGLDSTTAWLAGASALGITALAGSTIPLYCSCRSYPGIGRHFYAWLEVSAATGTTTWRSNSNPIVAGANPNGLFGLCWQ